VYPSHTGMVISIVCIHHIQVLVITFVRIHNKTCLVIMYILTYRHGHKNSVYPSHTGLAISIVYIHNIQTMLSAKPKLHILVIKSQLFQLMTHLHSESVLPQFAPRESRNRLHSGLEWLGMLRSQVNQVSSQ
jgi:hypothetical protein